MPSLPQSLTVREVVLQTPSHLHRKRGMRSRRKSPKSKGKWSMTCYAHKHKSMGLDGIHPRVLKKLVDVLVKPLSIIYQQSWLTGEVPVDWTSANVMPIYKNDWKEDSLNYRLVSLTSVPGKVIE